MPLTNEILKRTRNVSFEEMVVAIEAGQIVDVLKHHNPDRYPNQQVYLVQHMNYVFVVPFVKSPESDEIVLKTIYPSRKYTRRYIGEKRNE